MATKSILTLVGEELFKLGVRSVNGELVVPKSLDATTLTNALKDGVSADYDTLKKIEDAIKNINAVDLVDGASDAYNTLKKIEDAVVKLQNVMSTDTERIDAVNQLITAYEDADDTLKVLVDGKLGKTEKAADSDKLDGKSFTEVQTAILDAVETENYGTSDEFVAALEG